MPSIMHDYTAVAYKLDIPTDTEMQELTSESVESVVPSSVKVFLAGMTAACDGHSGGGDSSTWYTGGTSHCRPHIHVGPRRF
jgi:hypothetical protein